MEYQFKIPVNRTLNNKTGFEYRYNNIPESRIFTNPEIRKKYTVFWCFWVEQRETIFLVVSISPDKKNIILMKNMIWLWRKHSSGTENPQKVIFESKIDFWEPNWKIQIFVLFQKKVIFSQFLDLKLRPTQVFVNVGSILGSISGQIRAIIVKNGCILIRFNINTFNSDSSFFVARLLNGHLEQFFLSFVHVHL